MEQFFSQLDSIEAAFRRDPSLESVVPVVERSRADFATALEATLSGYPAVVSDAMRDVMEIEYLLLDFAVDLNRRDRWLTATPADLRRTFQPVQVRQRLNAAGEPPFGSSTESIDYRGHSEALHVTPRHHWLVRRGFSTGDDWSRDLGFWEMFEHGRRLLHAIRRFVTVASLDETSRRLVKTRLKDFEDGWERTQQMQTIFMALVEAAVSEDEERQPTKRRRGQGVQ
ncbi:MAG TPA: hypothetical protein VGR77_06050 [Candidatus Dormibacteraeota bacterium]|nr:hypothetical protein [Candidatus Dormibacteraeota bacterium]